MACLLLQAPTTVLMKEGLLWHQLTEKTLWLRKLVLDFGAHLNWPGEWETEWCFLFYTALYDLCFSFI